VLSEALGVTADYLLGRDGSARSMLEHQALLYETQDDFVERAGAFLAEGVERFETTLAVTTAPKVKLLRKRLGPLASDVTFAPAGRWYTTPAGALAAYHKFVEQKLEAGSGWIRILGEPVWSGRSAAEVVLWTRYESLLNLEFAGLPMTVVCPYDASGLDPEILEQACVTHQHTRAHGEIACNPEYRAPGDFALGS
jgi:hypothetical protein